MFLIIYFYVYECLACKHVCDYTEARKRHRSYEWLRAAMWCWELHPGPLQEQPFLAAGPPLQVPEHLILPMLN